MKKFVVIPLLATMLVLCCLSCNKSPQNIKYKIKKAELGTVEYTVRQIIRNSDETWQLFGDKKVLFSVKATMKAGIDLEKVQDDDIIVDGKHVSLTLPHAQIMAINILPKDITIAYSKVSVLRSDYSQQEYDAIMRAGEYSIKTDQDLRHSILTEAEANAKDFFELLLRSNGFEDIDIYFEN